MFLHKYVGQAFHIRSYTQSVDVPNPHMIPNLGVEYHPFWACTSEKRLSTDVWAMDIHMLYTVAHMTLCTHASIHTHTYLHEVRTYECA